MPAYCYFDMLEVTDPAKMGKYREGVAATVEKYNGRYLVLNGRHDLVEGDYRPTFPVLLEFPSLEQAHRWYDSPEYRPLRELRLSATRGNGVFIEGL
ncbi:MAG: DUF1330 domain-containing protein [Candidatus Binatia bacterium]